MKKLQTNCLHQRFQKQKRRPRNHYQSLLLNFVYYIIVETSFRNPLAILF